MSKNDINPANVQTRPIREDDVALAAGIDGNFLGTPNSEWYRGKPGLAGDGAGINTLLVAEARTTVLQAECER